jgi:hypothetical protein
MPNTDTPDIDAVLREAADVAANDGNVRQPTRDLISALVAEVARLRARVAGQAGQIGNARDAAGAGLGIPFYAYGDSEAACRLADALNSCASILDGGSS